MRDFSAPGDTKPFDSSLANRKHLQSSQNQSRNIKLAYTTNFTALNEKALAFEDMVENFSSAVSQQSKLNKKGDGQESLLAMSSKVRGSV